MKPISLVAPLALLTCVVVTPYVVAQEKAPEAPKPEIKSVSVLGVPRGKTVPVTIYGENLNTESAALDVRGTAVPVRLAAPMEKTSGDDAKNGGQKVRLDVTLPADCAPDVYTLTLTGTGGVKATAPLAIWEPAEQELEIKRPTATFTEAMPLPGSFAAVTGALLNGDTPDVFKFDARQGETYQIAAIAGRAGSQADLLVRLRDARHLSLALAGGYEKQDRSVTFRAPKDGTYFVEVWDAEGRSGPTYRYRLTLRRQPPPK